MHKIKEADIQERNEFLDSFIERMMIAKAEEKREDDRCPLINVGVSLEDTLCIIHHAIASFKEQKSLVRIEKSSLPVYIVGDLHGQFRDLRLILNRCGNPANQTYLFLGDYVDRGLQGAECLLLLLALKIRYPHKVFLLRGNHEDCNTATTYGFYDECMGKYAPHGEVAWTHFVNLFNWIPLAALVGEKILCMHGGLSPHISSLQAIENLPRPSIIPPYGLMCDLLWSDPDNKYQGWALSSRGISITFDDNLIEAFCNRFNIDLIVRAHQINSEMIKNGYKFFCNGRLVSIFSAPNYLNLNNASCVIKVNRDLACRFLVFKPRRAKGSIRSVKRASESSILAQEI